ncbi:Leucine-rich repeat serine/threonine-protein kinase 1 [Geodia barretti]|uniref:Leucine-rich repeat serine/threonine-protein kinase 1 n=3 Tax=Geodia barretti TaxID=519541 RepID=A0AA35S118_GEOBA|nr:Leucine-rich repeat serine/threonine-protein kinase 1 [Geodia barretti]
MFSAAAELEMEPHAHRPHLCLHVFGSRGSGKTTFKGQWLGSSHSQPLAEIADVEISISEGGVDLDSTQLPTTVTTDGITDHAFLVIYRSDSQESIQYALKCLRKLDTYYEAISPKVSVLENHFEDGFLPRHSEPSQLPQFLSDKVQIPCKFWAVRFQNGTDQRLLEHVIITPVMDLLKEDHKSLLIATACSQGQLQVLQLLAGRVEENDTVSWLICVMSSLQNQSPHSPLTPKLLQVADYLHNLDPTIFLSTIVRMTRTHALVSLDLINRFRPQGHSHDHFVKSGLALFSIPVSWFQNGNFTHIDLSNNLLLEVPDEMFRMSTLKGLNVSHNCLGSVPDILKWNCPYLRELNLSFNRLVDTKYCILNRPRNRSDPGMSDAGVPGRADQQAHFDEARRLQQLTGYNLYPCIHSLNWVNLSSNATLTQIPEWVCILPHLTLLELKNLPKLTSLTPYLAHCRNLCILKLDIHQLVSPPAREVANSGTRGIMAYLRCQLRGSSPYRHLKLVLVGANGTAKTTLFSQLAKLKSHPLTSSSPHLSKTFMELATLEYRGAGREEGGRKSHKFRPKITFHLIDFASEEVFQCFHQCFLTHRTLFLCLWDAARGVESLRSLGPCLRSIQASAPGSSVVVIGSHIDQRPGLSRATISQWEREVFGNRGQDAYPRNSGLPVVSDSVVMNCQSKRDVEKLMENVYRIALRLKHPRTHTPLVEEMVPRSYQELQTLVEVKLRGFQRKGQQVPVLRREEFIDHVRSLTLHHDDLEQDEEEFSLAVQFLHEAGTIVHYRPHVAGASELYFLSPQWLFNTLGIILSHLKSYCRNAVIPCSNLPFSFQKANIPPHLYSQFLGLLEENSVVVPLDMEKGHLLIPSVLSPDPPPEYPSYDFSEETEGYLMQYAYLDYLPSGFFPRLLARVIVCIGMLSGQLLAVGKSPLVTPNRPGNAVMKQHGARYNTIHRLDGQGYVTEDDETACGATSENRLREKIWALSTTNLATWPSRHQTIMEKLATLSRGPISHGEELHSRSNGSCTVGERENVADTQEHEEEEEEEETEEEGGESRNALELAENVVWQRGLHVEFPCGTRFWLEACEGAVAMVAQGGLVQRVKVITFLSACLDMLMEELYPGVRLVYYSPCPSCLSRYWSRNQQNSDSTSGTDFFLPTFAKSDFELSTEVTSLSLNEFKETASFNRRNSSSDHVTMAKSFSGSTLKLERSLSPTDEGDEKTLTTMNAAGEIIEEIPCAVLDNSIILYSLSSLVEKSSHRNYAQCSICEKPVALRDIGPHVLLVDFSDKLLISSRRLLYSEGRGSLLGEGSFGKVVKGTYDSHPVAVKLFRKYQSSESLSRQYKSLREEVTILSHLDHPRVVKLMGVSLRPLCLVMDLAPQGSLTNHLDLCPLGLSHTMAHRTLYQIADGISYLHSLYIIHRDIKPGNILVWSLDPDRGVDVRLADYGVSQFSTPSGLWRQRGTEEYMAPELRGSRNSAYDEKVDIFSFALLLHLIVTGRRLFAGVLSRRDQLQMIYHSDLPLLSHALAKSIEENRPRSSDPTLQHVFEKTSGKHPAARRNIDSSGHSHL